MSFSIDWPPGFRSRSCDPADPCFVGSVGKGTNSGRAPSEAVRKAFDKSGSDAFQLVVGGWSWRVYVLLRKQQGRVLSTREIAAALNIRVERAATLTRSLVNGGVLLRHRCTEDSRAHAYSLTAKPMEVR